jgi:hypothetical protein
MMSYSDLLLKLRPLCPENEEARKWMDSAVLQIEVLQQQLQDALDALEDTQRLTRELDIACFGKDAAKQASLCDLVKLIPEYIEELKSEK